MSSPRLVRCPFCSRRFNVAGIEAGRRLRCGFCTAVLTVPPSDARSGSRLRLTPSLLLQAGGGIAAGLVAAAALWIIFRPAPNAPAAPAAPAERAAAKAESAPAAPEPPTFLDDPASRATHEIEKEFGPRFYTKSAKPYLVALEPSERYHAASLLDDYGMRLQTLHGAFRLEFAEPLGLPDVDAALPVLIFSSRASFNRYCSERDRKPPPDSIKGIYEYERRRVVLYHDVNMPFEVLFHEGAHQLVHYYTRRETEGRRVLQSYWFQEGVGTYFEGFRRRGDGQIVHDLGAGRDRLPTLKQTLRSPELRRDFIPLSVLVGMTVDEFWKWFSDGEGLDAEGTTRKARLYYAESWAFVHFLRHSGGNGRALFDEYFRLEMTGQGGKDPFERLVRKHLGLELQQLEAKFIEHIHSLK
jgi:hypothetical protein